MYLFECEATFEAEPDAVWKVWTDVASWPEWDVSKEIAELDGPFEPGARGWARQRGNLGGSFTITMVDAGRRWVTECPVPMMGMVTFDHSLQPLAGGRVRLVKRAEVHGGAGPLLRLLANLPAAPRADRQFRLACHMMIMPCRFEDVIRSPAESDAGQPCRPCAWPRADQPAMRGL
jgi:hypothetical protein